MLISNAASSAQKRDCRLVSRLSIRCIRFLGIFPLACLIGLASPIATHGQAPLTLQLEINPSLRAELSWTPAAEPSLYTLESRDRLSDPWKPIPPASQWPTEATEFLDPRVTFLPNQRFYRLATTLIPKPERGKILAMEELGTLSFDEVNDLVEEVGVTALTPESGVTYYYVRYETIDISGKRTEASGGVIVPTDFNEPLPLFSYHQRTNLERDNVPSRFTFASFGSILPLVIASTGFVTAAPDYLGLGDSPGRHPLFIAQTSASAVLDLLPAAQSIGESAGVSVLPELYMMGYGAGGYVTTATHRAIDNDPESPYTVIATAPMAAPLELSGQFLDRLLEPDASYPDPYLLATLLVSHNELNPFYENPNEVFTDVVASQVIPRIDGVTSGAVLDSLLISSIPRDMLQPAFVEALENDSDHPFRVSLRENDLLDWAPQADVRIYHCSGDQTVPIEISETAVDVLLTNGAASVELINPIPVLNHDSCLDVSLVSAVTWLASQR